MFLNLLFKASLLLVTNVFALDNKLLSIKSTKPDVHLVAVEVSPDFQFVEGRVFFAVFDDGKKCRLILKSKVENLVQLDSSSCERENYLNVGQPIEVTDLLVDVKPAQIQDVPNQVQEIRPSISDLSYLAPEKKLSGLVAYSSNNIKYRATDAGIGDINLKKVGQTLGAGVMYGISEKIKMTVSGAYMPSSTTEFEGSNVSLRSTGFTDPTIGLIFRPMEVSKGTNLELQIGLSTSPSLIEAKSATANTDGNIASGRAKNSLNLSVYKKAAVTEFGLEINFEQNESGKDKNAETGIITEYSAVGTTTIGVIGQFAIDDLTFFRVKYGIGNDTATSSRNTSTGSVTNTSGVSSRALTFAGAYVFDPGRTLLDLGLSFVNADSFTSKSPSASLKISDYSSTLFFIGIKHEF